MDMDIGAQRKGEEVPGLVSVVLNFLNARSFMREAIESVFAQSYADWEMLLVDDGSTDGSTDIAKYFAAAEPERVRYLHHQDHENRGTSASRNLGIIKARGEFIAFLDADDVWLPNRLEYSVGLLRTHPSAAMVYGQSEYWYSWAGANAKSNDRVQPHGFAADHVVRGHVLLARYLAHTAAVPCPTSMTLRRRAALASGGFDESFRGMHDDYAFLARFCLQHDVYVAQLCWDRYRQHEASMCAVAEREGDTAAARAVYLAWVRVFFREKRITDRRLWSALRQAERLHYYNRAGWWPRLARAALSGWMAAKGQLVRQ